MQYAPLFAALAALASAAAPEVRGVDPSLSAKYQPTGKDNTFACLDGSKVIPFAAVNDDYCDCPDGSDEPGTSACEGRPAAWFYCKNEGHIPGKIRSGRVNDGICDPECCDGSDEWATGACPNRCAEIAKEYRERIERETKIRRTGAKIRTTYISYAQKERKRLLEELTAKRAEIKEKEKELEVAQAALKRAEDVSREDLDRKKATPIFRSLERHRDAVTKLKEESKALRSDLESVLAILGELSNNWNPNGQDMAVKAAVVGYRELTGQLPAASDGTEVKKEQGEGEDAAREGEFITEDDGEAEAEPLLYALKNPDGAMTEWELNHLLREDLEGLLQKDEPKTVAADDEEDSLLFRLEEYIPDSLFEYYDALRVGLVEALTSVGVLKRREVNDGPHVAVAREKANAAQRTVTDLQNAIGGIESTLARLDEQQDFGPHGEWKKLDGTCISTVAGDYTYELCFFGKATQKSNKDSSQNSLGSWEGWAEGAAPGSLEYYAKQRYRNGMKCWNGPYRSVNVELSCGKENEILSVTEPEKCEYKFKATSPALCWPEGDAGAQAGEPAQAQAAQAEPAKDEL